MATRKPIEVHCSNGQFLVWNVDGTYGSHSMASLVASSQQASQTLRLDTAFNLVHTLIPPKHHPALIPPKRHSALIQHHPALTFTHQPPTFCTPKRHQIHPKNLPVAGQLRRLDELAGRQLPEQDTRSAAAADGRGVPVPAGRVQRCATDPKERPTATTDRGLCERVRRVRATVSRRVPTFAPSERDRGDQRETADDRRG